MNVVSVLVIIPVVLIVVVCPMAQVWKIIVESVILIQLMTALKIVMVTGVELQN